MQKLLSIFVYLILLIFLESAAEVTGVPASAPAELPEELNYVALTFDDGPRRGTTTRLLDGLRERGANATFFLVGERLAGNEDLVLRMQAEVRAVTAKDSILDYITRLAMASREHPMVEVGISPRGTLFLDRMAKAHAYLEGRDYVTGGDVQAIFHDVCAHRVILNQKSRLSGGTVTQVLNELLETVEVPDRRQA